jgi:hypothetical protein
VQVRITLLLVWIVFVFASHTERSFGIISSTVNFNNNNDNKASPNTGTGLPRQMQFMVRFQF